MQLNKMIDHTLLKPQATDQDFLHLCEEAKTFQFMTVCVPPIFVKKCSEWLQESTVGVCTVVGFPHGNSLSKTKAFEAEHTVRQGAQEVDMVINLSAIKTKNFTAAKEDIETVVKAVPNNIVKVIIETCLLTDEEKITAAKICQQAGAHFVKTSTGFNGEGAKIEDIILIKNSIDVNMKIKASGGIKTQDWALKLIQAGASRLGTSSGVELVKNEIAKNGAY